MGHFSADIVILTSRQEYKIVYVYAALCQFVIYILISCYEIFRLQRALLKPFK